MHHPPSCRWKDEERWTVYVHLCNMACFNNQLRYLKKEVNDRLRLLWKLVRKWWPRLAWLAQMWAIKPSSFRLEASKAVSRRRQWHPIPVLLPGRSHGQRGLVGCSPWGRWESDTTELLTSLWLFTFVHWRRKWQPTPVFLPGESQGRGSLVGCHLWGRTELDTTEVT